MHILSAVIAAAVAAASPSSERNATVTLRYNDAGRPVKVVVGQVVRIALPANLGTGYRWVTRKGTAFRLAAPIRIETDPATPRLDATIVRIIFTKPGPITVELASVPSGGGGGGASDVLKYRFEVS